MMSVEQIEFVQRLPANTLLITGVGAEALAVGLSEIGCRVLTKPSSAADTAALEHGDPPPFLSLEKTETDLPTPLGAILILGYQPDYLPLALLNLAYDRLTSDGLLLLAIPKGPPETRSKKDQRRLDYLRALAQRCGLEPIEQTPNLVTDADTLILRKASRAPRWRLEELREGDIADFAALFREAFNTEIPLPLWHWKYGEGRGHGIIARRGERIIAHYGCTRRRALYFGRPIMALQMCDVMVDPRERGVMTKQGAMFLTTATMLELYLGLQPADLPFGFPSGRHERLGERLGLYAEVGRIAELRWPALPGRPHLSTRVRHLDRNDHDGNRNLVAELWEAMSRDLREAILLIRDWDYLVYRYLDNPIHRYEFILVTSRFSGKPLGLLVLRRIDDDTVELLDLIGSLDRVPMLIDQARRLTGRWGARSLFSWITRQHIEHFLTSDVSITDPDVSIPTNVWVDGPSVESLKDRWWLMSGDTEFH